jgi:hypothetical protein
VGPGGPGRARPVEWGRTGPLAAGVARRPEIICAQRSHHIPKEPDGRHGGDHANIDRSKSQSVARSRLGPPAAGQGTGAGRIRPGQDRLGRREVAMPHSDFYTS